LKIKFTHTINYFETDMNYKAKLPVLFQQLQNAAVSHAEKAGYRMDSLIQSGQGWVLNKMDIQPVIQTLLRYNYTIKASYFEADYFDSLRDRYNSLMNYLNI